jgi:hypothetical protein
MNGVVAVSWPRRPTRACWVDRAGHHHHNFVTHLLEAELQASTGSPKAGSRSPRRRAAGILEGIAWRHVEIDAGAALTWMR